MGQVHAQGRRQKMIDTLSAYTDRNFCNVNSAWQSEDSIGTEEYKQILRDSIFVPCPRGNNSADTFRLYEALEVGAIPILDQDDYWNNMFGDNPLLQTDDDWRRALIYINAFLKNEELLNAYQDQLQTWWREQKQKTKDTISCIFEKTQPTTQAPTKDRSTKQKQLIELTDQWIKFKDYDFLKYVDENTQKKDDVLKCFDCYNPGCRIGVVSLYTPEIASFAVESEKSIREYCENQGYTFYVYRESLDKDSHPNWSKSRALLNHCDDHDALVWMDSDTIVFDENMKFEDIIEQADDQKQILACEDIGSQNKNLPKGSLFNSGVVIFKKHAHTRKILQDWWDFRKHGDTSSLYSSGGDQEILIDIILKSDPDSNFLEVFPMNQFNTEPRFINENTFIVHFMAYPRTLKNIFMSYWNS